MHCTTAGRDGKETGRNDTGLDLRSKSLLCRSLFPSFSGSDCGVLGPFSTPANSMEDPQCDHTPSTPRSRGIYQTC